MNKTAAIIGGGVIGGGWAARFLLAGWDVRVFDPDPEAERKISEVMANARRSLPGLSDRPPPDEGRLSFCGTMSAAVEDASWIQESVPERLDLKRKVYQALQAICDPDAVVASSTSGFKPSELQGCATRAGQIVVAHPFNPVYLLPLVELVTTAHNPPDLIQSARRILTEIGMHPLHLAKEIDAHIADRLLEAVWREALWLINDEIATTEEIDDAIRYGFGLRWAQMGLFETYRIAGGEAGMRHFIEQFGPCLSWPWTKLMDVPDLTDMLIDRIADQSDAQSGQHSIRDLERIRDRNLVAILRGLREQGHAAGAILQQRDGGLAAANKRAVPLNWTNANGEMRPEYLSFAFSDASSAALAGHAATPTEATIRIDALPMAGETMVWTTEIQQADQVELRLCHVILVGERRIAEQTCRWSNPPAHLLDALQTP